MTPEISVVIPTYNRLEALQAVFPSYLRSPEIKEIIVVNDGSTDGTWEAVERLAKNSEKRIKLIEHSRRMGVTAARMNGFKASSGKWVLYGEDDVWLHEDYCTTLLSQAAQLSADIIAGRLVTLFTKASTAAEFDFELGIQETIARTDKLFYFDTLDVAYGAEFDSPISAPFVHAIMLIRREAFLDAAFDQFYSRGNGYREETDFQMVVASQGASIFFSPDTVCYHLRGPICASGGQRINRLLVEFWNIRNSYYLVSKHWKYLKGWGVKGRPILWLMRYVFVREKSQLQRILSSGPRSTFNVLG